MRTLYLDCGMGAAGDMLMAALLELVDDKAAFLEKMNGLGLPGVAVSAVPAVKCGITGTHVAVTVHGEEEVSCDVSPEGHIHHHDRSHEHGHEHSHEHEHGHEHEHHHHDHDHEDDDDHDEHEHHHHDEDGHCCCGHHHHHHDHDADEVFTSWGVETAKKFSKADIEHALTELDGGKYGMILRSKGIVDGGADGWLEFDYVPGEWEVRQRGADVGGKLVVIGSKLDEKAIAALFGC